MDSANQDLEVAVKTGHGVSGAVRLKRDVGGATGDLKESKPDEEEIERVDIKRKRLVRNLRATQRCITMVLSLAVTVIMSMTFAKYNQTKNVTGAWPQSPTLYPTFLLLAISAVSLAFDIITVFAYCWGVKAANRASTVASYIHYLVSIAHAIGWAIGAGVLRYIFVNGNTNDLWGWSCSDAAAALESINQTSQLCDTNTGAWAIAVLQAGSEILGIAILFYVYQRSRSKKRLRDAEEFLKRQTEY